MCFHRSTSPPEHLPQTRGESFGYKGGESTDPSRLWFCSCNSYRRGKGQEPSSERRGGEEISNWYIYWILFALEEIHLLGGLSREERNVYICIEIYREKGEG